MFEKYTIVDLTHSLNGKIPTWNGKKGFELKKNEEIVLSTSSGTHVDAPSYFEKNGRSIDSIPLKQLLLPACVLDLAAKVHPSYQISPDDLMEYEAKYGIIPKHSLLLAHTGWSRRWQKPKTYRNTDVRKNPIFPTFSLDAVKYLLKRNIAAIGIDTLGIEPLNSSFPCHRLLFSKNKYIIENIANSDKLPPKGAFAIILPLKIEGGPEAPARMIGLVPRKSEVYDSEIFCISYFHAKPQHRDELIRELLKIVEPTRAEPGCIYYEIYVDNEDPNFITLSSKFTSPKALAEHEKEPYIVRFIEGPMAKYCKKVTWKEAREIRLK